MSIVLLSGGQDSTTCLAWALKNLDEPVAALSVDYGQRHRVELECAGRIANHFAVPWDVAPLNSLAWLGAASLTNPSIPHQAHATQAAGNVYAARHGLPSSFIPGRNVLLLGLAAAYGAPGGHLSVTCGVCEADEAGYPDCRSDFVAAMRATLALALDEPAFTIHAPLLYLTKGRTFALAHTLGVLDVVLEETSTCYDGDRTRRHEWGYGCGECPACQTRARGYAEFQSFAPA